MNHNTNKTRFINFILFGETKLEVLLSGKPLLGEPRELSFEPSIYFLVQIWENHVETYFEINTKFQGNDNTTYWEFRGLGETRLFI